MERSHAPLYSTLVRWMGIFSFTYFIPLSEKCNSFENDNGVNSLLSNSTPKPIIFFISNISYLKAPQAGSGENTHPPHFIKSTMYDKHTFARGACRERQRTINNIVQISSTMLGVSCSIAHSFCLKDQIISVFCSFPACHWK